MVRVKKTTELVGVVGKPQCRCPSCGDNHTIRHGFNVTKKGKFARRKCQQCGTTFYENKEARV